MVNRALKWGFVFYERLFAPIVNWLLFAHLTHHTKDFLNVKWLGKRTWQNVLDLWTFQEAVWDVQPELIIETGTNKAGSAFFYANLFDLIGKGRVVTVDNQKLHNHSHPRIDFIIGDGVAPETVDKVREIVSRVKGPIMVVLDSDHSEQHVRKELESYSSFVTPNSYIWVQDGVIDTHFYFRENRPGPVPAIKKFLKSHPEFEVDHERCKRFLITTHPLGWLKRKA